MYIFMNVRSLGSAELAHSNKAKATIGYDRNPPIQFEVPGLFFFIYFFFGHNLPGLRGGGFKAFLKLNVLVDLGWTKGLPLCHLAHHQRLNKIITYWSLSIK
jgi:hypothetical protein